MIYNPYRISQLVGDWTATCVTLAMDVERVRAMLPDGLVLGPQWLVKKPSGFPLRFYFNQVNLTMTWPPTFPIIDYSEQVLGIPYVYRLGSAVQSQPVGPYYYMPRVFLDSTLALLGGLTMWGMEKRFARFNYASEILGPRWPGWSVDANPEQMTPGTPAPGWANVQVAGSYRERPTLGLDWKIAGEFERVTRPSDSQLLRHFAPHRAIMNQPLITEWPASVGPYHASALFQMVWPRARVRPVETKLVVYDEYVPGMLVGTYHSKSLEDSVLGAYQLQCPFVQWLPYSCDVADYIDEEAPQYESKFRLMTGPYRPRPIEAGRSSDPDANPRSPRPRHERREGQ